MDGIKTGYTNASGFNLLTSIRRDNRQLVAVVMGGSSAASRDIAMRRLVDSYMPRAYAGKATDRSNPAIVVADDNAGFSSIAAAPQKLPTVGPAMVGITLPWMPTGAPGIGGSKDGPLTVYAFTKNGKAAPTVYAVE